MKTASSPPPVFRIHDHPMHQPSTPLTPRHKHEKKFTLTKSSANPKTKDISRAITHLVVSTPGFTFVSYDAQATEPTIKILADAPEVIEAVQVRVPDPSSLELHLVQRLGKLHHVLTEVILPFTNSLHSLKVVGGASVVVEDHVLVANDPHAAVSLSLEGCGGIFVDSRMDLSIGSLDISNTSSGIVQVVAPRVTVGETFEAKATSSGNIRVFVGSIKATQIDLSTTSSGDIYIAALELHALTDFHAKSKSSGSIKTIGESLTAETIVASLGSSGDALFIATTDFVVTNVRASVTSSGDVYIASNNAACVTATLSTSSSGSVDTRDLAAQNAITKTSSSGNILVQARSSIDARASSSGSVLVIGDLPPQVHGKPLQRTVDQYPSKVETLAAKRTSSRPIPTRVEAFEKPTRIHGPKAKGRLSIWVASNWATSS